MSQVFFVATKADLKPGIEAVEKLHSLQYLKCGLFPHERQQSWKSALNIPKLGVAADGSRTRCDCFLVLPKDRVPVIRPVPQHRGGTLYAVDQLHNPVSITFEPGGMWTDKFLLSGNIGTVCSDEAAKALYRDFCRLLRKDFQKTSGRYPVGPEAARIAATGVRLISMHSEEDPTYDIRVSV